MKADHYAWWMSRLEDNFKLFDYLRIDHFRAFSSYCEIEANAETARDGKWIPGPGLDFFEEYDK